MTRPHLTTHRPSPTTALYTISTASPLTTLPARTLHILLLTLRLVLILLTLSALLLKLLPPNHQHALPPLLLTLHTNLLLPPWPHIFPPTLLLLLLLLTRRYHTTESLLVLRTLGIQTSASSASYLFPASTRFIPTSQIRDIFIHEAFRGFEVRYYLAVVVEGEGEVVVVFSGVLPGREVVEEVWRGARGCLYGTGGRRKGERREREEEG